MYISKDQADEIFYDTTTEGVFMQQLLRVLWLRNQISKATKLKVYYLREIEKQHILSNNFYVERLERMEQVKARLESSYKLAFKGLSLQTRIESERIKL